MDKLVSVIIPCYNAEAFIDHSIESVWIQDHYPIELIIVDDGSTDHSRERVKAWENRFAEKRQILKYIHQENQGPGGAVNTALKYVTGTYLTLLDADDVYLPGAISKKVLFLEQNLDYAGVRNNGWRVNGSERWLFINSKEEKQLSDLFTALSFGKTNNWAGTYMVRTSVLFEVYPDRNIDPSRLGQNLQILLPVSYCRKFGYIDEPLMEYRIQPESHSHSADANVRYEKELRNSAGWRDIYLNIIGWLITDQEKRDYYKNAYDSVFYRAAMLRAICHNKPEDIRTNYKLLKKTGHLSLDDRIAFSASVHPVFALPLRIVRKIRSLICET
jgi:glycosyltransferase involved in cell wall biosynthesis